MAVTFRDYSGDQVEAARSVRLELVRVLGEYRDDIVVVGGWVPQLQAALSIGRDSAMSGRSNWVNPEAQDRTIDG